MVDRNAFELTGSIAEAERLFIEDFDTWDMTGYYLYSKYWRAGVSAHIGTRGLRTADDARTLVSTALAAAIRGDISTAEAGDFVRVAESLARITGIAELQAKVQMLEERLSEVRS